MAVLEWSELAVVVVAVAAVVPHGGDSIYAARGTQRQIWV